MKAKIIDHQLFAIIAIFLSIAIPNCTNAQVYLYLENMTEVKAIKIPEGSHISIKTIEIPEWTEYKIDRLLPEEKVIIHETGMIDLADITKLRIERRWVRALGTSMQRFGYAWMAYGLIAAAADNFTLDTRFWIIGGSPIVAGYIMKKIWLHKIYTIGSKTRLKILDLSFPDDPYGVKEKVIRP